MRQVVEECADSDLIREMIGFAALRLMELNVGTAMIDATPATIRSAGRNLFVAQLPAIQRSIVFQEPTGSAHVFKVSHSPRRWRKKKRGLEMQEFDEIRARERAYQIWQSAGQPEGQHEAHWHQALRELGLDSLAETLPESGSEDVKSGGVTLVAAGNEPPAPEPNVRLPRM